MRGIRSAIILLILFSAVFGFFGWKLYRSRYQVPRKKSQEQLQQLDQMRQSRENYVTQRRQFIQNQQGLYAQSFPVQSAAARTEYQLWLSQMTDFCKMKDPQVTIRYDQQGQGIISHQFQVQAEATLEQLYRFLYEFYWTAYLHRIESLDLQPIQGSDHLQVSMIIGGLTMAKLNTQALFPLADQLPAAWSYTRRLASAPFGIYHSYAGINLFKYTQTGADDANFAILTGLPTTTDSEGNEVVVTRWNLPTLNQTKTVGIGQPLQIGSFDAVVEKVEGDMVYLRQSGQYLWALNLGDKLVDAVAIPETF